MDATIKSSYIKLRLQGIRAGEALRKARTSKSCSIDYPSFIPAANITRQPTRPNYAWIEKTEDVFRTVGFSDEIAKHITHEGWYTDEFGDNDQSLRGIVFRLNHGRGFIAGYADPNNDGAAFVELEVHAKADEAWALNDAALRADRIAELEAEEERARPAWPSCAKRAKDY